ncbi:MAG: hypothetical protein AAF194_06865, partial [Pseudomonadota bacterium]
MSCFRRYLRKGRDAGEIATGLILAMTILADLAAAESPEAVFEANRDSLFVVESYDRISNNKNSVGSGFAVKMGASAELRIATNYHVVADAVL